MPDLDAAKNRFIPVVRPDIAEMETYTPVVPFEVLSRQLGREPHEIVKLNANENPYGPSPLALEALSAFPWYHIYPDPQQQLLREALSGYAGVPSDYILPGHGADELLDYLCRLFLLPGDSIINCPPTFSMYSFDALLSGGKVIGVRRDEAFTLDVESIIRAVLESTMLPKILFLTSPNNPDGGLIARETLKRLLDLPILVVVDEAYVEFAGNEVSVAHWVPQTPNLVVLRTFSKWAGLAGLRLGYGIFPLAIIEHLWKFKQPYNVNVAAIVAGLASLQDLSSLRMTIAALVSEREHLFQGLSAIPYLHPLPSHANFVLCRVEGRSAMDVYQELAARGILVRYYDKPGLSNFIRISAAKPADTRSLLIALQNLA